MNTAKRMIGYILMLALGAVLMILGGMELVDEFYSGMGGALIAMSILRLVQFIRFKKDDTYREKREVELSDERNRFLRNKAWAWAGYLFILIAAVACIVLKVMGQDTLSMFCSSAVCLMMLLYWGSYLILRKKY